MFLCAHTSADEMYMLAPTFACVSRRHHSFPEHQELRKNILFLATSEKSQHTMCRTLGFSLFASPCPKRPERKTLETYKASVFRKSHYEQRKTRRKSECVWEGNLKGKKNKRKRIQEDEGRDCEKVFDIFQCYAYGRRTRLEHSGFFEI